VTTDVPMKASECPKAYLRRILEDGNVTLANISDYAGMKDKGNKT